MTTTISELLKRTVECNASDLHLSSGRPPLIRLDGQLQPIDPHAEPLSDATMRQMLDGIMTPDQKKIVTEQLECDLAYEVPGVSRFRVNVFHHQGGMGAVFRTISTQIQSLEALELPAEVIKRLMQKPYGLVLMTGPTGSGKSTTAAAMLDYINQTMNKHVITIEDPIEFLHQSKMCQITQREVHQHTHSFQGALRAALREDPDVIFVGEMRDIETIRLALTAAETGHLVLATLHTSTAAKTLDRIIDVFPASEKDMIRTMLSESLQAIIAQRLIRRSGGGRIAAIELMTCTPAIRNLIRESKVAQIFTAIQTGRADGMQTLEQHLQELLTKNMIANETVQEQLGTVSSE